MNSNASNCGRDNNIIECYYGEREKINAISLWLHKVSKWYANQRIKFSYLIVYKKCYCSFPLRHLFAYSHLIILIYLFLCSNIRYVLWILINALNRLWNKSWWTMKHSEKKIRFSITRRIIASIFFFFIYKLKSRGCRVDGDGVQVNVLEFWCDEMKIIHRNEELLIKSF